LLQIDARLHPDNNSSNTLANLTLTGHKPTETSLRGRGRGRGNGRGRSRSSRRSKNTRRSNRRRKHNNNRKNRSKNGSEFKEDEYFYCLKPGYYYEDCRLRKAAKAKAAKRKEARLNKSSETKHKAQTATI